MEDKLFKPYIAPEENVKEFTLKCFKGRPDRLRINSYCCDRDNLGSKIFEDNNFRK
jgi:hypothetical protein